MNIENLKGFLSVAKNHCEKHASDILFVAGVSCMLMGTASAIADTKNASMILEERKIDLDKDELTKKEALVAAAPCYIRTALFTATGVACLVGGKYLDNSKSAALAAAYGIVEATYKEYKEDVEEALTEKAKNKLEEHINERLMAEKPVEQETVIDTGNGETMCFDKWAGRYFYSDIDAIKRAFNEANQSLLENGTLSMNDLYFFLNLEDAELANMFEWVAPDDLVYPKFSSTLASNGQPCVVLDFSPRPKLKTYFSL